MSRGLGRAQLGILAMLAEAADIPPGGLITYDLAGPSYSAQSSARRALAGMRRRGLVTGDTHYPHMKGRPVLWKITDAGRAELARCVSDETPGQ